MSDHLNAYTKQIIAREPQRIHHTHLITFDLDDHTARVMTSDGILLDREWARSLIEQIADWYRSHTDAEIEEHNRHWQNWINSRPSLDEEDYTMSTVNAPISGKDGYVYILKSDSGFTKIGRTTDINNRMATFSVKLPYQVEFEHVIRTNNCVLLEAYLHGSFESKRIDGEWFDLSNEDIDAIRNLGDM